MMCDEGYTVGGVAGGSPYYEVECGPEGHFLAGLPAEGACLAPKYSVMGEVFNAQNSKDKVNGTSIVFKSQSGEEMASTTSDAVGRYTVQLPIGKYVASVSQSGWIAREKNIDVKGTIHKGQGADIALSRVLPYGGYRVVLNWGEHSKDLDSWTYWDTDYQKYVYYR